MRACIPFKDRWKWEEAQKKELWKMNNIYSCIHFAVLSCAYEFFRMRSVEEKLMRAVDSVSSMDKANIKKRFFPIFGGNHQKLYIKTPSFVYRSVLGEMEG